MSEHLSPGSTPDFPPRSSGKAIEFGVYIERARHTFEEYQHILKAAGATEFNTTTVPSSITELGTYIVRRENPASLMRAVETRKSLQITPIDRPTGVRYSNSALWHPSSTSGLDNAIHEGMTDTNGVVAILGFLEPHNADLVRLPDATAEFNGLNRTNVRSYMGSLDFADVRFIRLRVPIEAFSEEEMTPDEKDRLDVAIEARMKGTPKATYINRWYVFPREIQ